MGERKGLSVVVPVHNAFEELQACLASVARTTGPETQVIVIDDASTDTRIVPFVEAFMRTPGPRWRFIRQPQNVGFVATANLGMRLAHGDVVLLNSDTEVTDGWLDRLAECLASSADIATCTPWSNNGEIVSIPEFCKSNPVPRNATGIANTIAETVGAEGGPRYPELPTAVGFCMAISRTAIEAIGGFDAQHFGRGYGEENDFSLRARQKGLRNVLCDHAYVVHHGGRSFGPLGLKPDEDSMGRLLERHPDYLQEVERFIQEDPLREWRAKLV
ncbi:MAG: glycosyltransferase family 2 protein, partial [Xanthomonadales bacterium]|nr:glycosyltransferase family 2 protein [Xanthomonadales bacterium]